jgi:RNA polymerase sigma-70 factor (ECF subfamily)
MKRDDSLNLMGLGVHTDSELVQFTQQGNSEAFDHLVLRYRERLYRLARRLTDTEEDAEDVLQESFIRAYNAISSFKGKSRFSTWLYRITVNFALMKKRSKKSIFEYIDDPIETKRGEVRREFPDKGPDPLDMLLVKECRDIIDDAIGELAPTDRAVFVLRHVEGLTTTQASRALNLSVPALKSRLHRSRMALKGSLGDVFGDEPLAAAA